MDIDLSAIWDIATLLIESFQDILDVLLVRLFGKALDFLDNKIVADAFPWLFVVILLISVTIAYRRFFTRS